MTDTATTATTTTCRCMNCGDRRYIAGRASLPNGAFATRTPCYLCNPKGDR